MKCENCLTNFSQLEVPDQVNAMIEAFLRHYV